MPEDATTVHELRSHWKPTKESLRGDPTRQPLLIRIHRSCSWLQRAEESESVDDVLVMRWIAFNSLYGRWDPESREPQPDARTWDMFLGRVLELDAEGRTASVLQRERRLVMSILDDEFVSRYFWEDPSELRARKCRKVVYEARSWYVEGRYGMILRRVMERVYLVRCQLVHGAATYGGGLNRAAVRRCGAFLGRLLPAVLLTIMDRGCDEDWGLLCFPPIRAEHDHA